MAAELRRLRDELAAPVRGDDMLVNRGRRSAAERLGARADALDPPA